MAQKRAVLRIWNCLSKIKALFLRMLSRLAFSLSLSLGITLRVANILLAYPVLPVSIESFFKADSGAQLSTSVQVNSAE
jgi:hypothetical protein